MKNGRLTHSKDEEREATLVYLPWYTHPVYPTVYTLYIRLPAVYMPGTIPCFLVPFDTFKTGIVHF